MGTHKITNKQTGQYLTGILYDSPGVYYVISIDGTSEEVLFEFFDSDWCVEELPAPLPTTPGMYAVESGAFYHLDDAGNWGHVVAEGRYPRTVEQMQASGTLWPLAPVTGAVPGVEQ